MEFFSKTVFFFCFFFVFDRFRLFFLSTSFEEVAKHKIKYKKNERKRKTELIDIIMTIQYSPGRVPSCARLDG